MTDIHAGARSNPSRPLDEFLTEIEADAATLQIAVGYLAAMWSDDLGTEAMREALSGVAHPNKSVDATLESLEANPDAFDAVILRVVDIAWRDPVTHDATWSALSEARSKLVSPELGYAIIAGLYALQLLLTGGRKREVHRYKHRDDGSWEEQHEIEYAGPLEGLRSLVLPGSDSPGTGDAPNSSSSPPEIDRS